MRKPSKLLSLAGAAIIGGSTLMGCANLTDVRSPDHILRQHPVDNAIMETFFGRARSEDTKKEKYNEKEAILMNSDGRWIYWTENGSALEVKEECGKFFYRDWQNEWTQIPEDTKKVYAK